MSQIQTSIIPQVNVASNDMAAFPYRQYSFDDLNRARAAMFSDAAPITENELTAIKSEILHVLRWSVVSDFIPRRSIGKGLTQWQYAQWADVRPPRYTISFDRGSNVRTQKSLQTLNLIGFDYDFHITMPQLDLYSNENRLVRFQETLQQGNLTELTASLTQYREFSIFRGTDIPNMTDLGLTGLVNASGVQDPGPLGLGADDDLTAFGDVFHSATVMAAKLIDKKFKPPFVLQMTPKVYQQAMINKNTTYNNRTDLDLIMEYGREQGQPIFSRVDMNPFLIDSETETSTTGAMLVTKPDPSNYELIESYPLGYYPLPPQDLGIDGKLLWMGGMAVYRPNAVVYADALTTNV